MSIAYFVVFANTDNDNNCRIMTTIWSKKPIEMTILKQIVKHKYTKVKLLVDINRRVSRIYIKSVLIKRFDQFSDFELARKGINLKKKLS